MRSTLPLVGLVLLVALPVEGVTGSPRFPCPAGLALIPAGPLVMGSDAAERTYGYQIGSEAARRYRWFDRWELPRQTRRLEAVCLDRLPVTQREYQEFIRATGHRVPFIREAEYQAQGYLVHPYAEVTPYLWRDGASPADKANHPVVLVSQADGEAFCAWRGAQQGATCRLPTEAEWEKGARGTDGRYFPWGNTWDPDRLNSGYRVGSTTPVGHYPSGRSPFGLLDTAGNTFEWTASPFSPAQTVLKGCSWDDAPGICRSAGRHGRRADARHILFGFRCACEPSLERGRDLQNKP